MSCFVSTWLLAALLNQACAQESSATAPGDLGAIVINIPPHQIVGHSLIGQSSLLLLDAGGTLLTDYDLAANPITLACAVGEFSPNQISDPALFVAGVIDLSSLGIRYDGPSGSTAITASSANVVSTSVLVSFSGYDIIGVPGLVPGSDPQIYSNVATALSAVVSNGGDQTALRDPSVKAYFRSGGGSISIFFDPRDAGRPDTVEVDLPTTGLPSGPDTLVLVLESSYLSGEGEIDVFDTLKITMVVLSGQDLRLVPASLDPDSVYAGIPFDVSFLVSTGGIQKPWDSASFDLALVSELDSVLAVLYSGPVAYGDIRQDTLVYGGISMQVPPVFPVGTYRIRANYWVVSEGLRFGSAEPYVAELSVLPAPSLTYQTGTLTPTEVIAGQERAFYFDVLLDGDEEVLMAPAGSYFELRLGDFSSSVGFQVLGNRLYPGLNRVFTRRVFIPTDLVDESLEAGAVIAYYHPGSANRLSYSTDFDGRTIYVQATPKIQVVEAEVLSPNVPFVNTSQAFQIHCRIANISPTAMTSFDLELVTDGASQFEPSATVTGIPGNDTVDVYFDVVAAVEPTATEIFRIDIPSSDVPREQPVDNIAWVTIQRPADLAVVLNLSGADDGYVEVGAGFDLYLQLENTGEGRASSGTFLVSTNGMDLGLPGGATEVEKVVSVGQVSGISFTAPLYDTLIVLDVVLTQIPIDANTAARAAIGDTAFQVELAVTSSEVRLIVTAREVPSNVLFAGSTRDLVVLSVSNPASSSVSDIGLLSAAFDLTDRDGHALAAAAVLRLDSTHILADGVEVAHATASGSRLTLTFDDFVVAAGDTVELVLRTSIVDAGAPEFSLRLETENIQAAYAAGPQQGTAVPVATDDASGMVVSETFTLADKSLSGSFLVRDNPFDPLAGPAEFRYYLQKAENVTFVVLTLTGELVYRRDLTSGSPGATAGENTLFWDGRNDDDYTVVNGVYLAIISTGNGDDRATIKLAVVK